MDYREQPPQQVRYQFGFQRNTPPIVKTLIIINIVVFVAQTIAAKIPAVSLDWAALYYPHGLFRGWLWQFVTYAFMHSVADPFHLIFNMLFFWMFGSDIAAAFGRRRFITFYITAAIFSGILFVTFDMLRVYTGQNVAPAACLGASGVVMGVMMAYALYWPNRKILFMLIIPMRIRTLIIFLAAMDFYGALKAGGTIAHTAHLGGLLWGILFVRYWPRLETAWANRSSRKSAPSGYDTVGENPQDKAESRDAERVNALLDKIHREGIQSLSWREKRFLQNMSKKK
jgi:rhomboid family protein